MSARDDACQWCRDAAKEAVERAEGLQRRNNQLDLELGEVRNRLEAEVLRLQNRCAHLEHRLSLAPSPTPGERA